MRPERRVSAMATGTATAAAPTAILTTATLGSSGFAARSEFTEFSADLVVEGVIEADRDRATVVPLLASRFPRRRSSTFGSSHLADR